MDFRVMAKFQRLLYEGPRPITHSRKHLYHCNPSGRNTWTHNSWGIENPELSDIFRPLINPDPPVEVPAAPHSHNLLLYRDIPITEFRGELSGLDNIQEKGWWW